MVVYDDEGQIITVEIFYAAIREYEGLIRYLFAWDQKQFTISREEYLRIPAPLSDAMDIYRMIKSETQEKPNA
jgi:hypothetical protein